VYLYGCMEGADGSRSGIALGAEALPREMRFLSCYANAGLVIHLALVVDKSATAMCIIKAPSLAPCHCSECRFPVKTRWERALAHVLSVETWLVAGTLGS
jgi:hypothetical protein